SRIWLRRLQYHNLLRRPFDKTRRDQTHTSAGRRQGGRIFWIVEEAQIGSAGGIERRDVTDRTLGGIAGAKLGARQGGDRAGGEVAIRYDKIPHVAGVAFGPRSEFRAAARREKLGAVVGLLEEWIGKVKAQRPERRIPDDAGAGGGAHRRGVGILQGALAEERRGQPNRRSRIDRSDLAVDLASSWIRSFTSIAPQGAGIDEYGAAEAAVLG